MKYLIRIKYDGSHFYGFQRLNLELTVQKSIEEALTKIDKCKVVIKGASRTDRGVHAYGQCAHFDLAHTIPNDRLKKVLNKMLQPYIYITDCENVDESFHARFSVQEKTYEYKIYTGDYDPMKEDYYLYIKEDLDLKKMKKASQEFIGAFSFKNFVSGHRDNYDSEIYDVKIEQSNEFISIRFRGRSFYRYMVRNMVGSLLQVGLHRLEGNDIRKALNRPDKEVQLYTIKPNGLYLLNIKYE